MNNLPDSAIGAMRMMATTQTQIDVFSDQIIQSVKEGEASSLEVLALARAFEKAFKRVLPEIQQNILKDAELYPEKTFSFYGVEMTKSEVGVQYDFSVCGDPLHDRLESEFNTAKARLDERKKFLKGLNQPLKTIDEETGELIELRPPLKTSTSTVTVSIK